jgi:hypothetical protein
MIEIDTRFVAYAIWGAGTVLVYGAVFRLGLRRWRYRRDARAWRELLERTARFLVALASMASLTLALFGEAGTGARGLIVALALGAFTAAGVIELREEPSDPAADAYSEDH